MKLVSSPLLALPRTGSPVLAPANAAESAPKLASPAQPALGLWPCFPLERQEMKAGDAFRKEKVAFLMVPKVRCS